MFFLKCSLVFSLVLNEYGSHAYSNGSYAVLDPT